jgi:asparagine synthase (glutamine-hydrolysing)
MCGIAGFWSKEDSFSKEDLISMTRTLNHRGPDAEGYYFDKSIALGHKRLSILDLSSAADQPFYSRCGNFIIVFNGEVYNYKELATELDFLTRTTSDTEVIVELFAKFGSTFVNKLNGMFSFVIYDITKNKLHIFRDRMGVKPLFYYWDNNVFAFGSELKAVIDLPYVKSRLKNNKKVVGQVLHLGFITEPNTIYENIYKFPSASHGVLFSGKLTIDKYWFSAASIKKELWIDYKSAKKELKKLLISSVNYRMISDVPYGTFLSGGVDSSIVTAIAQSESNIPVKTFSLGFEEDKYNEIEYARSVAHYLKTDHHEFILSQKMALDSLEGIMDNFDEPYTDSSALPTFMVSKMARKHITMVLTGDGGDELFLGYGSYEWANRLDSVAVHAIRKVAAQLIYTFGNNRFKRVAGLINYEDRKNIRSHIFSQEQYFFSVQELKKITTPEYYSSMGFKNENDELLRKITPRERQALFDMNYYLKDDLLTKVDRATMLCSLEAREPLLDYRIVEFGLNLSEDIKKNKRILKDILYDYIPESYFNRPKWGFSIPLVEWLKKDLRYLIEDYLSESMISQVGIFRYDYIKDLKKRFEKGEYYLYQRLWTVIVIQRWFVKNAHTR